MRSLKSYGFAFLASVILVLGIDTPAHAFLNGNAVPYQSVQTYTPVLKGQTDDPVVTYATQVGQFYVLGNMVYINVNITTSGTVTKTTTSDAFAVSLPFPSATLASRNDTLSCDVENATAVSLGLTGVVGSNTSQATFLTYSAIVAGKGAPVTWATTTPGIGVLSNAITVKCSGWYMGNF